ASKDRLKGTADENNAVAKGVLAHFGTYSVNDADGSFTLHVEASSYANDNGTDQKRIVTSFTGDELRWTNPTPTTPFIACAVLRRVKHGRRPRAHGWAAPSGPPPHRRGARRRGRHYQPQCSPLPRRAIPSRGGSRWTGTRRAGGRPGHRQ